MNTRRITSKSIFATLALACFHISVPDGFGAASAVYTGGKAKIPVVYSVTKSTYTTLDGKPTSPDPKIHQPITPYPNVVWNQDKQSYQTLDGSPLPIMKSRGGGQGVPVEAIDPYWGVSGNGKRLRNDMSEEGRKAGKIPVYYDPNRYGYFDAADRPLQSWNVATHELVQPKPNVVWNADKQTYITRDGSPLPWIKDSRGWEGIPIEAIDPSLGTDSSAVYSPQRRSTKPEDKISDFSKKLAVSGQIDNWNKLLDLAQQRGGKVPTQAFEFLKQLKSGVEGDLRENMPDVGKSLQKVLEENKGKDQKRPTPTATPPAEKKHISERMRGMRTSISAQDLAAGRQLAAAQSSPQFRGNAVEEMQQLNADMQSAISSGRVSESINQNFANRHFDISQRMIGEMNAYSASMANWSRMNAMQSDVSRLMKAAQAGNAQAVSSAAIGMLDTLPASVGEPAKKYIGRMEANLSRQPAQSDPLTGRTDVDEESHAATADLFADLINNNPEGKDYILGEMARVDAVNDFVHGLNQEVEQLFEERYQQSVKEERPIRQKAASNPVKQLTPPTPSGDRKRDEEAMASYATSQRQQVKNKEYALEALKQFEKSVDFHNRSKDAKEAWYQSHRLGAMVAKRVNPGNQRVAKPGYAGTTTYYPDGSVTKIPGGFDPLPKNGVSEIDYNKPAPEILPFNDGLPPPPKPKKPDLGRPPRNPNVINDAGGERAKLNLSPRQKELLMQYYANLQKGAQPGYGGIITYNPDGTVTKVPGGVYPMPRNGVLEFDYTKPTNPKSQ